MPTENPSPRAGAETRAKTHAKLSNAPAASGVSAAPTPAESVLVLQGGGALGAYQAGVFEALCQHQHRPGWIAGISIGAINAALIAGNPPDQRVARLREFWDLVSAWLPRPPGAFASHSLLDRAALNEAAATQVMLFGVPGFFTPRVPPALFQPAGSPGATSVYDTTPLRATLERLVDFKRLNSGAVRVSVGAVNVRNGNFAYFDTAHQTLDVRHIMASGALPPGFAAVEIDGQHYWDGGLVSNTPLQYVLDQDSDRPRVVFQVDLFAAAGALPRNLDEALEREKDIRYSSRTRLNTTIQLDLQVVAQAAQRLLAKLPPALLDDPDALALARLRSASAVDVVHLIYRAKHDEGQAKDYEFSRLSMQEHWAAGHADAGHTLGDPRWTGRGESPSGVRVFDLLPRGPAADRPGPATRDPERAGPA